MIRAGQRVRVARVELDQRARIVARVTSGGDKVATLKRSCSRPGGVAVKWDGTTGGKGKRGAVAAGRYRVRVAVLSDRKPVKRSFSIRVRD